MLEDYDNVDYDYFKEWDIEQYKKEIERLNNIINKKEQFLGDNIKRLEREVVKRDNIINELEKWLYERSEFTNFGAVIDKLQELKGEDKE